MALLTPPDILPEAMRFLVRALVALGDVDVDRDELVGLVAPRGLAEAMDAVAAGLEELPDGEVEGRSGATGTAIATCSLDALRTLGIVEQYGGKIRLDPALRGRWQRVSEVYARDFSELLVDRVMEAADASAQPGVTDGAMDLVHGLVLLHVSESPLRPFDKFEPGPSERRIVRTFSQLQQERFGADNSCWPVKNGVRWVPFRRWAVYLQLARPIGASGLRADASAALASRLSGLQPAIYAADDFVAQCAIALPIMDGGPLQFGHDPQVEGDNAVLSPGMAVSLLQLEADGVLTMTKESDTGARTLRLSPDDRMSDRMITNVAWTGRPNIGRGDR